MTMYGTAVRMVVYINVKSELSFRIAAFRDDSVGAPSKPPWNRNSGHQLLLPHSFNFRMREYAHTAGGTRRLKYVR